MWLSKEEAPGVLEFCTGAETTLASSVKVVFLDQVWDWISKTWVSPGSYHFACAFPQVPSVSLPR